MKGMRPLTDQEVRDISGSFTGKFAARDKALFTLGVRTGFRVSELLSLQVQDVCPQGRVADQVSVRRSNMKGKREGRTFPLHPEAKAALQRWITEAQLTSGPLFPSQKAPSQAIDRRQAWTILHKAYKANGMDKGVGTHGMRKTLAARMYQKLGHDLLGVQKALGHKSLSSTTAYLSFNDAAVNAAFLV
jgi:integrase